MTRRFTRREIAAAVAGSAVLAAQSPNPPQPSQNPDAELTAARDMNRQNLEQIAKFPLLMTTEPAVHFKA